MILANSFTTCPSQGSRELSSHSQ